MFTKEQIDEYIARELCHVIWAEVNLASKARYEQAACEFRDVCDVYGVDPADAATIASYALNSVLIKAVNGLAAGQIEPGCVIVTSTLVGDVILCLAPYL